MRNEKTVTGLAASIASITERSTAQADAGSAELVTAGTPGREPRSNGRLRVIHLAAYGGPYAGSFIPMLARDRTRGRRTGYETTIWFSDIARGRPWLSELDDLAEIRWLESAGTNVARISSAVQALNSALVAVQRRLLAGLPAARIVPPEPLAIAEGIRELLSLEESERTKHAAEARARIAASYSLATWARRLVDLYAEVL